MAAAPYPLNSPGLQAVQAQACRARILTGAYVLLLIYASLHPLQGWQPAPRGFWSMLFAPWPRYWTGFDVGANVLAYLPLGWLSYLAWRGRRAAAGRAILLAALLSLSMEGMQNFLASRVASNLDILANTLGAALGVGLAWGGGRLLERAGRNTVAPTMRPDVPGGGAEVWAASAWALVLLIYGVLAQAAPTVAWMQLGDVTLLPGAAGMRNWLSGWVQPLWFGVAWLDAGWLVTLQVAANVLLLGLVCQASGQRGPGRGAACLLGVLLAGYLGRVLLSGLQAGGGTAPGLLLKEAPFIWSLVGVLTGAACFLWSSSWAARSRGMWSLALTGVVMLLALMQLGVSEPLPPGLLVLDRPLVARHLLNFMGLLQFLAALWPYLVLIWLLRYRAWRQG